MKKSRAAAKRGRQRTDRATDPVPYELKFVGKPDLLGAVSAKVTSPLLVPEMHHGRSTHVQVGRGRPPLGVEAPSDALDPWETACLVEYLRNQAAIRAILEGELSKDRDKRMTKRPGAAELPIWSQAKVALVDLATRRPAAKASGGKRHFAGKDLELALLARFVMDRSPEPPTPVRSSLTVMIEVEWDDERYRLVEFADEELFEFRVGLG